jgi:hypothetical protein
MCWIMGFNVQIIKTIDEYTLMTSEQKGNY